MQIPEFNPEELKVVGDVPYPMGLPSVPLYSFPISPKEAVSMVYQRKAPWQILPIMDVETLMFNPSIIPDNVARAFVADATFIPGKTNTTGGTDIFGIEWEYVPSAGGSMVRPGDPFIEDANELEEKLVWPDIESWDWEGSRKINETYVNQPKSVCTWIFNGYFERLISLMDFENAIVALIDEEQQDAVKAFFDKLTDFYIKLLDKMLTVFPEIDGIYFHDDWGSQRASFFSPETGAEMIVPYMKRLTDFLHSKGKYCHLHSCGHLMNQVENFIAAGWDAWDPQVMNDSHELYRLYGDQIVMGVTPTPFDPNTATEEEQRTAAREYAEQFCNPDKPSFLNIYTIAQYMMMTPIFREELYICSRKKYSGQ